MAERNFFYLPVARALAQTRILRERLLPRAGEVSVRLDDRVESVDIVARAAVPLPPKVVNLAQLFKVPRRRAKGFLLKREGDAFSKGEVLARKKRLLGPGLVIRAPFAGRVLAEHDGEVLLEVAPAEVELPANIKGAVANIMPRHGVVIQVTGGLVQGAWGNGKESYAVLKVLGETREQPLSAELIDVSCLGTIVVVGGTIEAGGLKQAEAQQVRGVIAGSMPATLREKALTLPFPLMITEGFGSVLMLPSAFELLKSYHTREASLRAVSQTRWGAQRPEVVVPLSAREGSSGEVAPPYAPLQKDVLVRVCAGDYLGQTGRVVSDRPQSRMLANGAHARAIEVELAEGERIWVPINNLEAIA